jgi:hypothetical protein
VAPNFRSKEFEPRRMKQWSDQGILAEGEEGPVRLTSLY